MCDVDHLSLVVLSQLLSGLDLEVLDLVRKVPGKIFLCWHSWLDDKQIIFVRKQIYYYSVIFVFQAAQIVDLAASENRVFLCLHSPLSNALNLF